MHTYTYTYTYIIDLHRYIDMHICPNTAHSSWTARRRHGPCPHLRNVATVLYLDVSVCVVHRVRVMYNPL